MVLAASGLHRADRAAEISELLDPQVMLPAPAQGALAIECRTEDLEADGPRRWLAEALTAYDDTPTRAAVTAERALLARLEAGCAAPVGTLASVENGMLTLRVAVASPDGSEVMRRTEASHELSTAAARELGRRVGDGLLADGAARLAGLA